AEAVLDIKAAAYDQTGVNFRAPNRQLPTDRTIVGDLIIIPESDLVAGLTRDAHLLVMDLSSESGEFLLAELPDSPTATSGVGVGSGLATSAGDLILVSRDASWIEKVDMAQLRSLPATPSDLNPSELDLTAAQSAGVVAFLDTTPLA